MAPEELNVTEEQIAEAEKAVDDAIGGSEVSAAVAGARHLNMPSMAGAKGLKAKMEAKRSKKHQKQLDELKKKGLTDEQAKMYVAQQAYANQPIDQKVMRLEAMVAQSMQQLAKEMVALRQNDEILADAMDANLRAIARCLELAGVDKAKQGEIIAQVQQEMADERATEIQAAKDAQLKAQQDLSEKALLTSLKEEPKLMETEQAPVDVPVPPEATQFGG